MLSLHIGGDKVIKMDFKVNIRGFTLLELSIVLVIIGILLGSGISLFRLYVKNAKLKETRDVVYTACEAIKGYAMSYKKLPDNLSNLGIRVKDSYGDDLIYKFASGLDVNDFCQNDGGWINLTDKGITRNKVAFIVYSKGENYQDDTDRGSGVYKIEEYGTDVGGRHYDDVVCYTDINALRRVACSSFEITTDKLPMGTQYLPYYKTTFEVSDGEISSCSIDNPSNLPDGINFNSSDCSLSGTPEKAGSFNFTITVKDTIGREASKSFTLIINPNPVRIATPYLPYAYVGNNYSVALSATGATGEYTWQKTDGSLPAGLSLSGNKISGTPTAAGVYNFTVKACDKNFHAACDSRMFSISVLKSTGGGSGGGSGGDGDGGSGDDGGDEGSHCSSYEVHLIKSSYSSDYINSVYIDECKKVSTTRKHYVFKNVKASTIKLFSSTHCSGSSLVYNLASIDYNNDCKVYISCEGSSKRCKVYNSEVVYCPKAKFYCKDSKIKLKKYWCRMSVSINSGETVSVFDKKCKKHLCDYHFNGEFSPSLDRDLDCKVKIDKECKLSDK